MVGSKLKFVLLCSLATLLFFPGGVRSKERSTATILPPFYAEYLSSETYGWFFHDKAIRTLSQLKNGHWKYELQLKSLFADVRESTEFEWENNQVRPLHYTYYRSGWGIKKRQAELFFNWKTLTVINDVAHTRWKMSITPDTQDKLSYQIQLRVDLINKKKLLHYDVADGGRLKQFRFKVIRAETLQTTLGKIKTTVVKVIKKTGHFNSSTLWFAHKWKYLLIRIVNKDRNKKPIIINLNRYLAK